ncbi:MULTISPECIES: arginine deiminase family protein [unclassified Siphonobacter]|uniref:arginine deiminase family protein n=1 Tax=unclassified Siphonobacter TaxID=2635712 RepID=UPI000CC89226|nr:MULTISPECIES: arginine deiminase family protein [unclassified Siphonobacter]MDQ1088454.1 arginine deiminase [Siphonobacter sp. SORGH_AS_1065]MDR6194597.1 arginine deiminase [Siphonobacter sp. SORGH_AS_0500]PKK37867.1 amidinotransferase [Siphonobacter sp. SORGH_AS_0500]
MQSISVSSEVGTLKRLLIHSPDSGLGKVVPSKAQDWLFEDIVHLDTMRKDEYDYYVKILLYFLDPEKIKGKLAAIDADPKRSFYKPDHPEYFNSSRVIEFQKLLADILDNDQVKTKLIAAICAVEHEWYTTQNELSELSSVELAKTLISGTTPAGEMLFAPVPNFIFTRDIGITINDHFLLNKPAKQARTREALLAQYIFYTHPVFADLRGKIIELPDNELYFLLPDNEKNYNKTTLEGGDVMIVAPNHLVIGVSERTTVFAAQQAIKILFEKHVVDKITVVKIPFKRDYMHLDTVCTQVKKNVWVVLGSLLKQGRHGEDQIDPTMSGLIPPKLDDDVKIVQFFKGETATRELASLEELLIQISVEDLGCSPEEVRFIYSGNNEFPYGAREQWTDSCNLLALKEGVVIGYDRNDKTLEAFRQQGFRTVRAADLLQEFEQGITSPDTLTDTFIMLPSAELSRARGGSHCMSMPLLRS